MSEVFFYHLEGLNAEDVLPDLLQRGFIRGLRMAVETSDSTRLLAFSQKLWAIEDVGFLAHGLEGEPFPKRQMIWLATDGENPNGASYRFYYGGALPSAEASYERVSVMFDGSDATELQNARQLWRDFKARGAVVKYWKKDESGRWADLAQRTETASETGDGRTGKFT
jgi:DNA polymerase III subunit chi